MNNTINKMKNTLEGINSKITDTEEWFWSELEDRMVEISAIEYNKKKERNEGSFRELLGSTTRTNSEITCFL